MKRIWIGTIAVILVAGLGWCFLSKKEAKEDTVKIIADLPLTGDFSYFGNEVKHSLELLSDSANKYNIQFIFEDNQSNVNQSVSIFNKYHSNNSVPLIITCNSPFSAPVRAMADKSQKNQLALVTGALGFCDNYQWVFRDAITQDQEGELIASYVMNKTTYKKVALCAVNDDYGLGGAKAFRDILVSNNYEITREEYYATGNNDFKNIIVKLLNDKPDMIFFVGREQSYISFINQLRERDNDTPLFCTDSFESESVYNGIGERAKGIIFAGYYNDLDNPQSIDFINDYQKAYGTKPGIYAIDAYVAGQYIVDIVSKGSKDALSFNKSLSTMVFDSPIKGKLHVKDRSVISNVALYVINSEGKKELIFHE